MKPVFQRIANRMLEQDMPVAAVFKTLTAVIVIRTIIEKLLSAGHTLLYDPAEHYGCLVGDLQMYFSWVVIFLAMSIPVAFFLQVGYRDALKLTLVGFCIIICVPLIDYIATWGKGDEIRYFRNFDSFFYNYVNLFNPFVAMKGVTLGVRLEVLTLFCGSFLFAWRGFGRGILRSLLLALTLYTIVYFFGYIIPIHRLAGLDPSSTWRQSATHVDAVQILFFFYLAPFILCLAGIALVIRHQAKAAGRAVVEFLYPSRLLFYLWLLLFGFLFTAQQTGALPKILNPAELLKLLCAACSITLLFVYAKIINDIHDLAIDRISNSRRPLVVGVIGEDEAAGLATFTLALSGVLAIPVERDFFYLWLFIWGLSYLYSTPPFRLRRFWPVGHVVLALVGIGVFMAGACIARPNDFYMVWKDKAVLAYLMFAFFFVCQIKDLKDIEGDQAAGVANLFGRVSHPRVLALIFYGCFLGMAFLLATSIGVGIAATTAGTLVCAAVAIIMILRTRELAGLDRLFVISFVFILYLSGAWLFHHLA